MTLLARLGEGRTPLVESSRIGPSMGLSDLWFKLESCNPSGSYKDRFIAAQMTAMRRAGVRVCIATSSGNTGSALAAYCARYDVACYIIVNQMAPAGKLFQMRAHGARVLRVEDFMAAPEITGRVYGILSRLSEHAGIPLVVSAYRYSPEGMTGVESIAHELIEECGRAPDHVWAPVGGGGLLTAVCKGLAETTARVHAVQPSGCCPVVDAFARGVEDVRPTHSTTRISGLAVPFDMDAGRALQALRACGGLAVAVEDEEVWEAQRLLLLVEGIYCEPAGAAALAGLRRAVRQGDVERDGKVVCLVTGHGFKDVDSIAKAAAQHPEMVLPAHQLAEYLEAALERP